MLRYVTPDGPRSSSDGPPPRRNVCRRSPVARGSRRRDRSDIEPDDLREGDHGLRPLRRLDPRSRRLWHPRSTQAVSSNSPSTTYVALPICCQTLRRKAAGATGFVSFDCALDLADDTDATIDQAVDLQPVDSITSVASFFVSRLDAKPTRCIPPARRYRADRSSQRPPCLRALATGASPAKDGTRWHAQAPSRSRRCGRAPPPTIPPTPTRSTSSG